jgi:hypothetical protein
MTDSEAVLGAEVSSKQIQAEQKSSASSYDKALFSLPP